MTLVIEIKDSYIEDKNHEASNVMTILITTTNLSTDCINSEQLFMLEQEKSEKKKLMVSNKLVYNNLEKWRVKEESKLKKGIKQAI